MTEQFAGYPVAYDPAHDSPAHAARPKRNRDRRVHDEYPPYEWPTRLVEVAHVYHLYPTVVDHWRRATEPSKPYDRLVDEILVDFPAALGSPPQNVRAVGYVPEVVKAPYDVYFQPTQAREAATA